MKLAAVIFLLALMAGVIHRQTPTLNEVSVAYPEGYRNWAHVKSALISPAHKRLASNGGFQHI